MGFAGGSSQQQPLLQQQDAVPPSAPPLVYGGQLQQAGYAPAYAPPPALPQPAPGYPAVPVLQQPAMLQQQQQLSYAPPPPQLVAQHTHIHMPDEPLITRLAAAAPRQAVCPACQAAGPTQVRREAGCCTYLAVAAICWWCPLCACLPCCLDGCKDLVHRCSVCGSELARVRPC